MTFLGEQFKRVKHFTYEVTDESFYITSIHTDGHAFAISLVMSIDGDETAAYPEDVVLMNWGDFPSVIEAQAEAARLALMHWYDDEQFETETRVP